MQRPCMDPSHPAQSYTGGMILPRVVHGNGNSTLVEMAALTVSLVAKHLLPFISAPNFSSLLCSNVPMFIANYPFPLEPLPVFLRD